MKKGLALGVMVCGLFAQAQQVPRPEEYQQAVRILQGEPASGKPALAAKTRAKQAGSVPVIQGEITGGAIQVQRQAPLPNNAKLALALSEDWLNSGPSPTVGSGGRVVYLYGQGVPTVVCSLLQVCELDLEPGEQANKDALDWGDHRFEVATRSAGNGPDEFTYLVLKPTQAGLDTTLTIGTNKRPYYVRLLSTEHEHMVRIAFRYPEEEEQKRKTAEEAKREEARRQAAEAERLAQLNTAKPIRNWKYRVKLHGKDARYLWPERIGDDGIHTHIALSEEARHRGLPVLQLSDARGPIPANVRWDGNELIVDAVFQHACLLEGVGRKQQRACITNDGLSERSKGDASRN